MTTSTIEKMDKKACAAISDAVEKALQEVAEGLGLQVKVGGGSYDPTTGTFKPKVEFSLAGSEEAAFRRDAPLLFFDDRRLTGDEYGAEFDYAGKRMRLVAVNLRAPKFPFIAEEIGTDARFKLPGDQTVAAIRAERG